MPAPSAGMTDRGAIIASGPELSLRAQRSNLPQQGTSPAGDCPVACAPRNDLRGHFAFLIELTGGRLAPASA
jgi:hypothetical protein